MKNIFLIGLVLFSLSSCVARHNERYDNQSGKIVVTEGLYVFGVIPYITTESSYYPNQRRPDSVVEVRYR